MEKPENRSADYPSLLDRARALVDGPGGSDEKLLAVCALLSAEIPRYNWVGFYRANAAQDELVLGPFVGEPTEHRRIPFGRGLCGRAAAERQTVLSDDVSREGNYLSCSVKTQSEIVVPILKGGRCLGELDVDSHRRAAFTSDDREFLEALCRMTADLVG